MDIVTEAATSNDERTIGKALTRIEAMEPRTPEAAVAWEMAIDLLEKALAATKAAERLQDALHFYAQEEAQTQAA